MLLVIALSACGGSAATEPAREPTQEFPSATTESPPVPISPTSQPQPAIPERRYLTLEFPPRIRAGDSDIVRLKLEVDDLGNLTPTAVVGGNVVTGDVIEIPNLYETHYVVAEARFDIAGVEMRPSELVSMPLPHSFGVSALNRRESIAAPSGCICGSWIS